jgi:hypothetical protein
VIEVNMIAGMGHGTPLGDRLGAPGPYMLDVGISSTREIARFWSIAQTASESAATRATPATRASERLPAHSNWPDGETAKTRSPEPRHTTSDAPGVKKTIEDALRAAGLMR